MIIIYGLSKNLVKNIENLYFVYNFIFYCYYLVWIQFILCHEKLTMILKILILLLEKKKTLGIY